MARKAIARKKTPARGGRAAAKKPAPLRILFASSECTPYAKVGGLADVVGSLPKALRHLGHDVRVLLPLYSDIDRKRHGITPAGSSCVHMGGKREDWIGLHSATLDGEVPVWFVDYGAYFDRPGVYDGPRGEYQDNAFRYALLSKAALQVCKDFHFIPDVMHAHDWPTALVPVFLKTWDKILSPLSATASVLTIHNIGYQGVYDAAVYPYIGVGYEHYHPGAFENYGKVNLLKAGIHFADAITTVSPSYAAEIQGPVGGHGLAPYLSDRHADLTGILNGVDLDHWNPATDRHLPARFSRHDLAGKAACKAALQRRMGLEVRPDVPLFGIISRFAHQKGFDLVRAAFPPALSRMAMQVAVLGTGDPGIEDFFRWLSSAYRGRAGCHVGFSVELSHLIEAGSDFFVMPSLYEPCGLNQMYSMIYGTLPVVRATGGLEDTVANYNEATGDGTGFKFYAPTASALHDTIGWAVSTWYDRPGHIRQMRARGMAQDFSWETSAAQYVQVYERALARRRA